MVAQLQFLAMLLDLAWSLTVLRLASIGLAIAVGGLIFALVRLVSSLILISSLHCPIPNGSRSLESEPMVFDACLSVDNLLTFGSCSCLVCTS